MARDKIANPVLRTVYEYFIITVAIEILVAGIYFFVFPNHFSFGGVSGFASVFSVLTGLHATTFANIVNCFLLVLGFIFLGREVGIRTVYATLVMSVTLSLLEKYVPMPSPITDQPLLELVFAVMLPAFASAILFDISASSGGSDIIAMILRKYTSINIGTALLIVDAAAVVLAFFVFGPSVGLFSLLGLVSKSLGIDSITESINRCKCFTVVCDNPEPLCDYIIKNLHRGATVYEARGAYSNMPKTVIMTTMKPYQAIQLRNFIRSADPSAFIQISNSSEIIGQGFTPI